MGFPVPFAVRFGPLLAAITLLVLCASRGEAQTTLFSGGSLDDLRRLSSTLQFGRLVIDGELEIDRNRDAGVTIRASEFELTRNGSITHTQTACSYLPAPDVTILATGHVRIDGFISLTGKSGERECSGCDCQTTCNRCFGTDGADLVVKGRRITITGQPNRIGLDVSGGGGSSITDRGFDPRIGCRTLFVTGCSGGDGGRIRLEATTSIELQGANFDVEGGWGGSGNLGGPDGRDGDLAAFEWSAPMTNVAETEPNGSFEPDPAFFPGRAQPLVAVPLRLQGFVSYTDDQGDANAITIFYPSPPNDRLEDLFALHVNESRTVSIELEAADSRRDLDLFVLDLTQAPNFPILASSTGPPGTLERIDQFLPVGQYLIGVSWCCDISTLPPPPGTDYELRLFPELLPEPSSAMLAATALATLAVLARGRARWRGRLPGRPAAARRPEIVSDRPRRVAARSGAFALLLFLLLSPGSLNGRIIPREIGSLDTPGRASDVAVMGGLALRRGRLLGACG